MSEVANLNTVEWKLCSKRARTFVPLHGNPATRKVNWKSSPKLVESTEHSVKGHENDITIPFNDIDTHSSVF